MKLLVNENKTKNKKILLLILITTIISIAIVGIILFLVINSSSDKNINSNKNEKTKEEIEILTSEFDNIFINDLKNKEEQINFKAKFEDQPIIFTRMQGEKSESNQYDIKIHIPYINIDNETVEKYNKEIEEFISKTNSLLESVEQNTIYTVEYVASIKDGILSLLIRSNLKEGTSAQRVIIQTYNYDIENEKEISLEEVLDLKGKDKPQIQNQIKNHIQEEQKKVEDLKELGYNIYNRDYTSEIYDIENSTQFYISDDNIYIIYAYGNKGFTSEMDLVII